MKKQVRIILALVLMASMTLGTLAVVGANPRHMQPTVTVRMSPDTICHPSDPTVENVIQYVEGFGIGFAFNDDAVELPNLDFGDGVRAVSISFAAQEVASDIEVVVGSLENAAIATIVTSETQGWQESEGGVFYVNLPEALVGTQTVFLRWVHGLGSLYSVSFWPEHLGNPGLTAVASVGMTPDTICHPVDPTVENPIQYVEGFGIGHAGHGDFVELPDVDFGGGVSSIGVLFASAYRPAPLEIILNDINNPPAAIVYTAYSGGWTEDYAVMSYANFAEAVSGVNTVFIRWGAGIGSLYNVVFYAEQAFVGDFAPFEANPDMITHGPQIAYHEPSGGIGHTAAGDMIELPNVNFAGIPALSVVAEFAMDGVNTTLGVFINDPNSEPVALIPMSSTGGWGRDDAQFFAAPLDIPLTGTYTVFVRWMDNTGSLYSFQFLQHRVAPPAPPEPPAPPAAPEVYRPSAAAGDYLIATMVDDLTGWQNVYGWAEMSRDLVAINSIRVGQGIRHVIVFNFQQPMDFSEFSYLQFEVMTPNIELLNTAYEATVDIFDPEYRYMKWEYNVAGWPQDGRTPNIATQSGEWATIQVPLYQDGWISGAYAGFNLAHVRGFRMFLVDADRDLEGTYLHMRNLTLTNSPMSTAGLPPREDAPEEDTAEAPADAPDDSEEDAPAPAPVSDDEGGLSTAVIVIIIAAAVVAIGGICAFFVLKGKKKPDDTTEKK